MQGIFQASEGWELLHTHTGSSNTQTHILRSYLFQEFIQKYITYAFKTMAISPPVTSKILSTHTINHKYKDLTQIKTQIKAYERLKKYQCIAELHQILVQDDDNEVIKQFYRNFLKKQDKKGRYVSLIIQFCDKGSLKNYLSEKKELTQTEIIRFSVDILNCLLCLKREGIIHRDIHTDNLLITEKGIKLTDFDTAFLKDFSDLTQLAVPIRQNSSAPQLLHLFNLDQDEKRQIQTNEVYQQQQKCDIFSFGAVLFELIVGIQFKRQILNRLYESSKSSELKVLVSGMLEERPLERYSIQEISQIIKRLALKKGVQFKDNIVREQKNVFFKLPELIFHPSSCSDSNSNSLQMSDWSLEQAPILVRKVFDHPEIKIPLSPKLKRFQKPRHFTLNN